MTDKILGGCVFLVDDHPSIRQGLRLLLEREGFTVQGEDSCATAAMARLAEQDVDLAVVDLNFERGDGFGLISALQARATPVLVYSMHEDAANIERSLYAGAISYVSKRENFQDFLEGVHKTLKGIRYISPRATLSLAESKLYADQVLRCSAREMQILDMLGQGMGITAIANQLGISVRTVETYGKRLHEKLELSGMKELRQFAVRRITG
jgi:DNA-binding NarL/FixJ family response regulator